MISKFQRFKDFKVSKILWASPTAAGPLAAGFWMFAPWSFFSLLKCVLARWFLDVSFHVIFLGMIVNSEMDSVIFGAQNLSLGRPGASIFAPWGTILAPWAVVGDHGSSRKDTSEFGIGFVSISGRF